MTIPPVHFLLVDDLEENLLSLEALLRREDLVLLKARSGPEALELLLQHDVALALLDVQMPGMNGFELAELMRGTERTRRIPIIFLTAGSADSQRRFRGYEAGAVDFLHKPIEPDIMRSKADVFFELYRQRQQLALQRDHLAAAAVENSRLLKESLAYADALEQVDHRKDVFIATLAHELRNPLAPIRNGLQILRMSPSPETTADIQDMMDRQLTHLVRLIDDLLDVARISRGKIELRKEDITVQDAVNAAVEASRPLIETGQHQFTLEMSSAPLWLHADMTRIAQIISNLINNAAKYTPDGGQIHVAVTSTDKDVSIAVTDNGVGIPADMLPRIFELFTQVDSSMERSQGGLGIGLALVKRLLNMHDGKISVTSAGANQGSTFTVQLPLTTPAAADTSSTATNDNTSDEAAAALHVLVVDDNIPSAKTTGWMLEMIGHQATLIHDGIQAVETAREIKPDAILLDIGLPGMNGYDVCRELRKDPAFKDTMIIAQTGWGQENDRQQARDAGFDHHLLKPLDLDDVTALLATVRK